MVPDHLLPLADAVRCYLFNSQLVTLPDTPRAAGGIALLAPVECETFPPAAAAIDLLRRAANLRDVYYVDVRQSMRNGGGPACLRLRAVLTPEQQAAVHPHARLTPALYKALRACIEKHYRDQLLPADLADPRLLEESRAALANLHEILHLPTPE
jgi:succinylarginine dihydrolase